MVAVVYHGSRRVIKPSSCCAPGGLTHLVTKRLGLSLLRSANHRDHPCTFGKRWGLNTLQSANHRDHPCTFEKLGTKSKIFRILNLRSMIEAKKSESRNSLCYN
ncbi:hypothetical protein Hanom_Chr10g00953831 [Helianthus anomalus]